MGGSSPQPARSKAVMYLSPGWEVKFLYCEYQAPATVPAAMVSNWATWPVVWAAQGPASPS